MTTAAPAVAAGRPAGLPSQSLLLTRRSLRALSRNPAVMAFTLVQPVIWLLLFGQLFSSVVHLPGFHAPAGASYLSPSSPPAWSS